VETFPLAATGNVAPTTNISGEIDETYIFDDAHRTAIDSSGNIYVTDLGANSVDIFAAGATGNVAPTKTISGTNTGLCRPSGIALDSTGKIYVSNQYSEEETCTGYTITVYAAGATGNATPIQTISGANTGLDEPNGLALDSNNNIYVANEDSSTVTVYAATATGNVAPTTTIGGAATGIEYPHAVALDTAGNIYVTNPDTPSVTVYAAGATGNATPKATISGTSTGLVHPNGIAVDTTGKIYVVDISADIDGNYGAVFVYAAGANGNVAPTATIGGPLTLIDDAHGVSLH
jgi:sugar lactone lactonase YvrE